LSFWDAVHVRENLVKLNNYQCELLTKEAKKILNNMSDAQKYLPETKNVKSNLETEIMELNKLWNLRYYEEMFQLFTFYICYKFLKLLITFWSFAGREFISLVECEILRNSMTIFNLRICLIVQVIFFQVVIQWLSRRHSM
jgi:hypothetical protein